jgi:benzoyl-CoA reductase subunit C
MTETETTTDPAAADPAQPVVDRAQHIVEDLDFEHVKQWKKDNPGALAVGYLPIYVPRPLIEALGCLPVAVFGGGDQLDIIRGDSYFQSYICHIPRSIIEMALSAKLDVLDAVMFPSICDVVRNLSGMWKMLFPEVYAAYMDLPQNFDPHLGGKFYASEMRRIAGELTKRGAKPLDDDALRAAIEAENSRRDALAELDQLRREEPWRIKASEAYLISRAGTGMFAADHDVMVREFLAAVREREARPYDNVRVVVRGSFCEQPPMGLIRTLEKSGCDIVDDDFQLGLRFIEGRIEVGDDPVEAISMAYLRKGCATASRYIADDEKGAALIESVKRTKADGVIFAAASFCDPALLDQPMLEAALKRAEIPYTSLKYAENTGQFNVIREQAGAFSDSVKLWGSAA